MNKSQTPCCPECNSIKAVIPFFYGLPTLQTILDAKAGTIALGDSSLWPERPSHTCTSCSKEFNEIGVTGMWTNPFVKSATSTIAA